MNNLLKPSRLPWIVLGAGILGALLRTLIFAFGRDAHGLLTPNYFASVLLWVLTLSIAAVLLIGTMDLKQAAKYRFNYPASTIGAAGIAAAAAGILVTTVLNFSMADSLDVLRTVAGLLCVASLLFISHCRWKGLHPSILFYVIVCAYLMLDLICVYRLRSSDPQVQDYCFPLLASVSVMLAVYQDAAFAANAGDRQLHTLFHLAAVYFCLVSLPWCDQPVFYLTAAVWMLTNLCNLTPMPRDIPEEG